MNSNILLANIFDDNIDDLNFADLDLNIKDEDKDEDYHNLKIKDEKKDIKNIKDIEEVRLSNKKKIENKKNDDIEVRLSNSKKIENKSLYNNLQRKLFKYEKEAIKRDFLLKYEQDLNKNKKYGGGQESKKRDLLFKNEQDFNKDIEKLQDLKGKNNENKNNYIWKYYNTELNKYSFYSSKLQSIINLEFNKGSKYVYYEIEDNEYILFFSTMKQISKLGTIKEVIKEIQL